MAIDRRPSDPNVLGNQYDVTSLVFPNDLGYLRDKENYVAFYINVPGTSQVVADGLTFSDDLAEIGPGTVKQSTSNIPFTSIPSGTKINYKRVKTAIVLPIMERPVAHYGADWDMTDLGPVVGWALSNSLDTNGIVADLGKGDFAGAKAGMMAGFKGAGADIADATKALSLSALNVGASIVGLGGSAGAKDIFGILRRTALNEHRTQLFKSMRFRNFTFEYHLTPKSAADANIIKNIIYQFKYHMHSESNQSNIFLTYPSEFDIVFYFKGQENGGPQPQQQNLFKISTCALTDMEVEYGGDPFYTFKDGMPTEIVLKLSFMELELLTKERIQVGF